MKNVFFVLRVGTISDRINVYQKVRDTYYDYVSGDIIVFPLNRGSKLRVNVVKRERRFDLEREGFTVWIIYCQTDLFQDKKVSIDIADSLVESGDWYYEEDFKKEYPNFF